MPGTYKLKILVEELTNLLTKYDEIEIWRSTTGDEGDRVLYDTVALVAGPDETVVLYYDDVAGEDSYAAWYRYHHTVTDLVSDYSKKIQYGTSDAWYVTIEDLRDEGITEEMASNERLIDRILLAQSFIDRVTGRHFSAVEKTIRIDSLSSPELYIPEPIVKIDAVEYQELGSSSPYTHSYDLSLMRIYNRHLTQGLLEPDDREYPRVIIPPEYWPTPTWIGSFIDTRQGMNITGIFGYTELRPQDTIGETSPGSQVPISWGVTPPAIKECMTRLIVRWLSPLGESDFRRMDEMTGRVKEWRTRYQSMTYLTPGELTQGGGLPTITGDPEIDLTLWLYTAKGKLRVAAA